MNLLQRIYKRIRLRYINMKNQYDYFERLTTPSVVEGELFIVDASGEKSPLHRLQDDDFHIKPGKSYLFYVADPGGEQ